MEAMVKVGKKRAIYIPKRIAEKLGISEGDMLKIKVFSNKIEIEKIEDPIELAIRGEKFASVTHKEIEEVSENEQKKRIESSA